eukprot:5039903-Prymnesium_polylepis.1
MLVGAAALLLLALGAAADEVANDHHDHAHDHHDHDDHPPLMCDRPAAREARKAINDMLLPLARSYGAEMSETCPLNNAHDRLLTHEEAKRPSSQFQWKCQICGKQFRSERYIDMHMDRKHLATLPPNATTCLGEFCDILRCPGWVRGIKQMLRDNPAACRERDLEGRRHFCQHLMHDCFTPQSGAVRG